MVRRRRRVDGSPLVGLLLLCSACGSDARGDGVFDSMGGSADSSSPATDSPTSASNGGGDSEDDDPLGSTSDEFKFDTPAGGDTAGDDPGNCNCGNEQWSYVFVANSQEGTVSKINTRTLEEEGRYLTSPGGTGNPSRTSVSIDGRAVAVANRHVGIVKIWAREEFCRDHNGQPGIQTSTGADDVLPWGQDDCIAWFTDFPDMTVQRPVQWTSGRGACHSDQKVWTVTGTNGIGPGMCGSGGVWAHRLNGDTGDVEDTIHLDDSVFACSPTANVPGGGGGTGLGAYGGAVDADGNFYFHGFGNGKLARIDNETLAVETFFGGGYGITVDTHGRVWTSSSLARFDYATGERVTANVSGSGGLAQDLQGRMWASDGNAGVVWVDLETLAVGDSVPLPGTNTVKGVSVDIDGYIWAVRQDEPTAYKIDPDTYAIETYDGLSNPYTYSDMTGGALTNVTCNPPEG